ncbi:response regulator transcription factor [Neomicrococcus lactis]|uniref:response regulator transcription factor n=1 Tax=Neomicrococcus lactis TaxID=732241 RepID=UPI002300C93F|nr:response regulator transcription factor [Neomicrococcus lactis]
MSKILIIEDEERIAQFVAKGLTKQGFHPAVALTGREGLYLAQTGDFELVLLDLGLPDMDGFAVLQEIRGAHNDVPVIVLTARTSIEDTVYGLEEGANDYVAKPFRFEELVARIRLRLPSDTNGADLNDLTAGNITLELRTRQVRVGDEYVELSAREFALAESFLRNPRVVLSREQLLSRVWGQESDPASNVVDVYVRYLRKKLGAEHFDTVRGLGYRFMP